jgi:hypothetical protein
LWQHSQEWLCHKNANPGTGGTGILACAKFSGWGDFKETVCDVRGVGWRWVLLGGSTAPSKLRAGRNGCATQQQSSNPSRLDSNQTIEARGEEAEEAEVAEYLELLANLGLDVAVCGMQAGQLLFEFINIVEGEFGLL